MIHVERVHVVTDAPLGEAQARAVGTQMVGEMNAALKNQRARAPDVHIGELQLNLPRSAIGDSAALARHARSVAQRILDRTE